MHQVCKPFPNTQFVIVEKQEFVVNKANGRKPTFLTPCYVRVRNVGFFEYLPYFLFLLSQICTDITYYHGFQIRPFALLLTNLGIRKYCTLLRNSVIKFTYLKLVSAIFLKLKIHQV